MRIFFVGMHNKPGMKPLDSRTMSGKMIDAIIEKLPYDCIKTNLCDVDYLPTDRKEIRNAGVKWHHSHEPDRTDIVVLLGRWVQDNFWYDNLNTVNLPHPASCMGYVTKENYIKNAIEILALNK